MRVSVLEDMSRGGLVSAVRSYPIPFIAIGGILLAILLSVLGLSPGVVKLVYLAVLLIGGIPLSFKTVRQMARGKFSVDLIALFSIVTALIMDQAFAGAVIVLMQSGGEALENYGNRRSTRELTKLLQRMPKSAHLKKGDDIKDISAEAVNIGDILIVKPGELFPVDGIIVNGYTRADESSITGEPALIVRGSGDAVMSGTINVSSSVEMRAERESKDSEYSRIVDLVRYAQRDRAPVERIADRYGIYLIPITLLVAFAGWIITRNPVTILAVFVVATPCPLILATPIAFMGGLSKAAREGIIVKGGTPLEQLGKADAIFFDKTGTLTYGRPSIEKLIPLAEYNDEFLFRIAGSVESLSIHPIAVEIAYIARIRFQNLQVPEDFVEEPGRGVSARVDGLSVKIGSSLYCMEGKLKNKRKAVKTIEKLEQTHGARSLSFMTIDDELAGAILFTDFIRPGVPKMLADLKDIGIKETVLLTGDGERNARMISDEAGISRFEYSLKPEGKTDYINQEKGKHRSIVMVGDGINDAPALASASVGVAMGARGADISAEASDVVITVDDVLKVRDAIAIGKRTLKIAMQSIFMGMALSSAFMVVAALGYIEPAVGAVIQEGIDIMAIVNSLRTRF